MKRLAGIFLTALAVVLVSFASENLNVGDQAPNFTVSYATKDTIVSNGFSLASAVGRNNIILAFYPADWSGGCTKEMCTMRDNFAALDELGCDVYGISGDYVYSHREWAKQLGLQFALLSDHSHEAAKLYQSYNPDSGMNRRTIFLIDKQGKIAYIDMDYKAGTLDSFNKLKAAISSLAN
ncbi:MAG: peroxiredoxin [Ignavibacteriae bacterium]|nr:peroxiredoxin [Ignavibacteriota bacterium]